MYLQIVTLSIPIPLQETNKQTNKTDLDATQLRSKDVTVLELITSQHTSKATELSPM